jgi:hypothetical protein
MKKTDDERYRKGEKKTAGMIGTRQKNTLFPYFLQGP